MKIEHYYRVFEPRSTVIDPREGLIVHLSELNRISTPHLPIFHQEGRDGIEGIEGTICYNADYSEFCIFGYNKIFKSSLCKYLHELKIKYKSGGYPREHFRENGVRKKRFTFGDETIEINWDEYEFDEIKEKR